MKKIAKIIKFKQHKAGYGGWSNWVYPKEKTKYLFKCCDCNLVHEMEFGTFIEKNKKRGTFEVVKLPHQIRSMFRARRLR